MEMVSKEYLLKAFGAFNDEKHAPEGWMSAMRTAREIVEEAPSVDAVEVVRCKDCAFRFTACPMVVRVGSFIQFFTEDEDFCSRGRREP